MSEVTIKIRAPRSRHLSEADMVDVHRRFTVRGTEEESGPEVERHLCALLESLGVRVTILWHGDEVTQ